MRYLGIDYGVRRIGLAVSDAESGIASPLSVLDRVGNVDAQVRAVIAAGAEYEVEGYVLGLPLNMDGSEGPQARLTREFGRCLARVSGKPVTEWDERLSSQGADERMAGADLTRQGKKRRRDALAAHIILQSYLEARRGD